MLYQEALFVDRERKYRGFQKLLQPETRQAVMLITSPEKMGKTWLAIKMERHCRRSEVNLPVVRIDFRNPLDQLKVTDHLAFIRLLRDRLDQPDYFHHLNTVINHVTDATRSQMTTSGQRLAVLAQLIQKFYDLNELRRLARMLGVEFDNLQGSILFDKAYGLVVHFARRNAMTELFDQLAEERGQIAWHESFADLVEIESTDEAEITSIDLFVDKGLSLTSTAVVEQQMAERLINDAFFDSIADMIRDFGQVIFLIDAIEQAPQVAADFITGQLLVQLLDERLQDMVIVILGREVPDVSDLNIDSLIVKTGLDAFNERYVRDFMHSRNIIEDNERWNIQSALTFSGGVPGILALMADQAKLTQNDDDDFFD
ncbi:MAG: hypothetical protein AAF702_20425 [Chloroflexota bacterium]